MATFRYSGKSARGENTAGVVDAESLHAALELLLERGLRDVQVTELMADQVPGEPLPVEAEVVMGPDEKQEPTSPFAEPPVRLSTPDAHELAMQVAQVSVAKVPLAAGLRAAAEETASRRVALALHWIADQTDQGRSLEDTLSHSGRMLPGYISGLILAAAGTGRLGEALFELVEQEQVMRGVRRRVREGFSYTLLVLLFAIPVLVFIIGYVTGDFEVVFGEFGLKLPLLTEMLLWWHNYGLAVLACLLLALTLLAMLLRLVLGRARWQRLMSTMPLFGKLWSAIGVAEWSGLLSVLLRHEITLPQALRLAGHGMRNAHIGDVSLRLADGAARGKSLSQLMYSYPELPSTLIPLVEWGEHHGALSESFRVGREMFENRAATRGTLINSILSPLLFVAIATVVAIVVMALFMPLVGLISKLS